MQTLYHWHHTAITSLDFTASGMSFYSSGLESVLTKWDINNQHKKFIPRTSAIIRHITVSAATSEVAISTADNSIQIVGLDALFKDSLQEFTYIVDDKTSESKFPVGLRFNPRSNSLVLNGRTGHLQFYSTYTKNLLYNVSWFKVVSIKL